jgi:hypothetical protein
MQANGGIEENVFNNKTGTKFVMIKQINQNRIICLFGAWEKSISF